MELVPEGRSVLLVVQDFDRRVAVLCDRRANLRDRSSGR
jgi:hypothetical protein